MLSGGMLKPMTTGEMGVEAEVWSWFGRTSMWRALPLTVTRRFLRGDGIRLDGAGAASGGGELSSCSCFTRTEALEKGIELKKIEQHGEKNIYTQSRRLYSYASWMAA